MKGLGFIRSARLRQDWDTMATRRIAAAQTPEFRGNVEGALAHLAGATLL